MKDITITIDGKIHKLTYSDKVINCPNCSLYSFCNKNKLRNCPATLLGGEYFVELKIRGESVNLELPTVMYVHQLQHALRLCGIEIEIKLRNDY